MQHGVHPVGELGGFSFHQEIFYEFLMLVDHQIQLEAVEIEQFFNVFLAVGGGINSNLPAIISQLVE